MTRTPRHLRRMLGLALPLLTLPLLAVATPAAEAGTAPFQLIRKLQVAQEQIARGNAAAPALQAQLMAAMPPSFMDADPAVWRDPRNARAAVLYLFSGGRPSVIRSILARSVMPRDIDPLLKGALAYAEGQDGVARELLQPIEPRTLPSALGGHLALVKATLLAQTDPVAARKLLDTARLLVPGTLVEEAALRRQIFLETDPAALSQFVFLSRQYLHRFRTSIYAENFRQQFAAIAIRMGSAGDLGQLGLLDAAIDEMTPDDQRALYLAVAKAAIVQGRTEAARFAAQRAAAVARTTAHDALRAQLYMSAALVASEDVGKGVAALEAADRSRLSPDDAELRDAALAVARSVTMPVADSSAAGQTAAAAKDGLALVDQARQALADGDRLLQDGAP